MARSLRLVTTIKDLEARNKPLKCSVRESGDNLSKKRGYSNKTLRVDLTVFADPILTAMLWKLLSQSEKFCMNFAIWLYKEWKFEGKNGGKKCFLSQSKIFCLLSHVKLQNMISHGSL